MASTHALTRSAAAWPRAPLYIAGIVAAIAAIYWSTVRELAGLGQRDDGQFLLVVGAFLFMVWESREMLDHVPMRPSQAGVWLLAFLGLVWMVGELALVRVLTDAAVVGMIPALVLAICGMPWVRALAFPLAFVMLAIPIEQPLAPILADWTGDVVVRLLELSGVAVQREGVYFSIPSGDWTIADACSGMNYMTSCIIVSLFFAYTQFRSLSRRAAFIAGAIALGVTGNWLRAYLTVFIAHLSDNRLLREEHGGFGWVVYAVLFIAYGAAWWRYRDAEVRRDAGEKPSRGVSTDRITGVTLGALLVVLAAPLFVAASAPSGDRLANDVRMTGGGGWSLAWKAATEWVPFLHKPTFERRYSFARGDRRVDLDIGWFEHETWDSKLISVLNRLVEPGGGPAWALAERSTQKTLLGGDDRESLCRGAARRAGAGMAVVLGSGRDDR